VECADGMIVISGIRRGHRGSDGKGLLGRDPHGPFYRELRVRLR